MPEECVINHCSPTLAGLKTANMFSVRPEPGERIVEEVKKLNRLLREKGLRIVILRQMNQRVLLYLYRPDYLDRDLASPEAIEILEAKGYRCGSSGSCIAQLMRHMAKDKEFPHEVGLFLGYPPEDVRSFMKDSRSGVKCAGCWKAYGNEEEAKKTFAKYRKCTEVYRRELTKGKSLLQLAVRTAGRSGQDKMHHRKAW